MKASGAPQEPGALSGLPVSLTRAGSGPGTAAAGSLSTPALGACGLERRDSEPLAEPLLDTVTSTSSSYY